MMFIPSFQQNNVVAIERRPEGCDMTMLSSSFVRNSAASYIILLYEYLSAMWLNLSQLLHSCFGSLLCQVLSYCPWLGYYDKNLSPVKPF